MGKPRRRFSSEFRAEIVKLVLTGRQSVPEVCKAHELHASSVYAWVRQAKIDEGSGAASDLSTAEKQEFGKLRAEVRELRRERDFLSRAAAYFAQEKKRGLL